MNGPEKLARPVKMSKEDFSVLIPMSTRLRDNDSYGHMNNAVYNEYFDTAVNQTLIELGVLDMRSGDLIGLVVHTSTSYFEAVGFPDRLTVGMRVGRIGRTSVRYELALFRENQNVAAAQCDFTHAYVDRATNTPQTLPLSLREALAPLLVQAVG